MKKTHNIFLILAFSLVSTSLWASNGLRTISAGPLSLGRGGAGVANNKTSNTILINPAGMNDVGNQADLHFTVAFPNTHMGSSLAPAGNPDAVNAAGNDDALILPEGSMVLSFKDGKFALGVGAFFSAGFTVDFDVSRFNSAITANRYDRSGRYANLKILPAASYRVLDNLSVGLGLDINYAFFQSDSATLAPGFPETAGTNRTDSALGIGGRIGILYKPIKMLSLGLTYVTRQHFQRFDRYSDLIPTGLDLPQEFAFGLSVVPMEGLTVLTDFRWIDWSSGFIGSDLAAGGLEWRDQYVFAGGVDYNLDPKLGLPIAIRVGYNYGRSPITPKNAFRNLVIPLTIEHHFTTGFSFDLSDHIGMDFAYIHEFGNTVTDNGTGNPAGAGSFVSASANAISIGVRGSWGDKKK
ncbi:MAG TPA: hypothetical protein DF383_05170 [Deltaproteobacteria bacterium]|nr:hypothetical protein [Deltaproteobacteria bacterium]